MKDLKVKVICATYRDQVLPLLNCPLYVDHLLHLEPFIDLRAVICRILSHQGITTYHYQLQTHLAR